MRPACATTNIARSLSKVQCWSISSLIGTVGSQLCRFVLSDRIGYAAHSQVLINALIVQVLLHISGNPTYQALTISSPHPPQSPKITCPLAVVTVPPSGGFGPFAVALPFFRRLRR